MNRSLLLSVKPQYARALLAGSKTAEVRRKFPDVPNGTIIVLYSSSPERAVVGTVRLRRLVRIAPDKVWDTYSDEIEIDRGSLDEYLTGAASSAVLEVDSPKAWQQPISLAMLRAHAQLEPPQSFRYLAESQLAAIHSMREFPPPS